MAELLKNMYSPLFVKQLANDIARHDPSFDPTNFVDDVLDRDWQLRELKSRMHHIASTLRSHLPAAFDKAVGILKEVTLTERMKSSNGFTDMVFPDFIEQFGLDHFETSVDALELFTQTSSAEFAVRPFILKYPDRMMKQMEQWTKHPNDHVRRLSTEGCRPRLPWAKALPIFKKDPRPVLRILERLKNDPSEYVRRSVANNLNDISKDHPNTVVDIARKWKGGTPETDALLKHALRGLLKKGDRRALRLMGSEHTRGVSATISIEPKSVRIGNSLTLMGTVRCTGKKLLRLEYAIGFLTSTGRTSRKVFQISGKTVHRETTFVKAHSFLDRTVRRHYPGTHTLELIVNGKIMAKSDFYLTR